MWIFLDLLVEDIEHTAKPVSFASLSTKYVRALLNELGTLIFWSFHKLKSKGIITWSTIMILVSVV